MPPAAHGRDRRRRCGAEARFFGVKGRFREDEIAQRSVTGQVAALSRAGRGRAKTPRGRRQVCLPDLGIEALLRIARVLVRQLLL